MKKRILVLYNNMNYSMVTTFSKYENKQASKSTSARAKQEKGLNKNGEKGEVPLPSTTCQGE